MYTRVGGRGILLSMNPYQSVNTEEVLKRVPGGFYSTEEMHAYLKVAMTPNAGIMSPHIFQIAADAYTRCLGIGRAAEKADQTIIITGDSGAGKTENAKQVFSFISCAKPGDLTATMQLKEKFDQSNFILEAFGNAKTILNNNSSRFTKLMTLYFDSAQNLTAARAKTFLLEKPRISEPGPAERNYHVFYQMLRGLPQKELGDRMLTPLREDGSPILTYAPMLPATSYNIPGAAKDYDLKEFNDMSNAMISLMGPGVVVEIWDLLAALLLLGRAEIGGRVDPKWGNFTKGGGVATSTDTGAEDMSQASRCTPPLFLHLGDVPYPPPILPYHYHLHTSQAAWRDASWEVRKRCS